MSIETLIAATNLKSLLTTGAVLGAGGSVFYTLSGYAKSALSKISSTIERFLIYEVEVISSRENAAYAWFEVYFNSNPRLRKSNRQMLSTGIAVDQAAEDGESIYGNRQTLTRFEDQYGLTPSTGSHVFWFHGTIFWFTKKQDKLLDRFIYTYSIRTFAWNRGVFLRLIEEAKGLLQPRIGLRINQNTGDYWGAH